MVTEERDKFRNMVNEFKRPKNDDGVGDETANRTLIQVLERYSCFLFRALLCCFFFPDVFFLSFGFICTGA